MEENIIISTKSALEDDAKDDKREKQPYAHKHKNNFKEKECDVIACNKKEKTLDVNFDGFGIRIKNVDGFIGDKALIKYKGEIGKPNFIYKL